MKNTRRKSIGLIFLITAIVVAIINGIAGYQSMYSWGMKQYVAICFFVSILLFVIACIILWHSFTIKSIIVRMFFVFLLMYVVLSLHFISNPNIFSLIFLLVWAMLSIQGFFYYPKRRRFMGLTFLLLGFGVVTLFLIIENNVPVEPDLPLLTDIPLMICGLTSASLILLGLFYLMPLSKKNNRPESNRFLIFYMSIAGFIGIIAAILKGIDKGWFDFFGALGWGLLIMFIPWILYKLRQTRLYLLWLLMFGFPALVGALVMFISECFISSSPYGNSYYTGLITALAIISGCIIGIISPIGIMGIYRIPTFSDFKKFIFPKRLLITSSKDDKESNNRGFTLIEMLIAVAILAILSAGIINTFSMVMVGSRHLELQNQAVIVAQNELEQLKAQSAFLVSADNMITPSSQLKEWIKSVPGAEGKIIVSKYKDTSLKQVEVHVQWMEGARKESVELTTILGGKP